MGKRPITDRVGFVVYVDLDPTPGPSLIRGRP